MSKKKLILVCYSATILLGSYLMFQIEPVAGKIITPRFGGTAGVWTMTILFFQFVLLGGYSLTYCISKLPLRLQAITYVALLVGSVLLLNVPSPDAWIIAFPDAPIKGVSWVLLSYLAFPCLMLSTVSGLMQHWYKQSGLGDPYYLYGLSNIGSLGALLAYPALVEPNLTLENTVSIWRVGYFILVAAGCISALILFLKTRSQTTNTDIAHTDSTAAAGDVATSSDSRGVFSHVIEFAVWVALPALGAMQLMIFTNYLTTDIAPVPLLWVVPLAIYLLSFVFCFGSGKFYNRMLFLSLGTLILIVWPAYEFKFLRVPALISVLMCSVALFVLNCVCHGELYRKRPHADRLTTFYLAIAIGGLLGGLLINIVSPVTINTYMERWLVLTVSLVATAGILIKQVFAWENRAAKLALAGFLSFVCMFSIVVGWNLQQVLITSSTCIVRNFYGCLRVAKIKDESTGTEVLKLFHGWIAHGSQHLDPARRNEPTLYFRLPVEIVVDAVRQVGLASNHGSLRMGVIGLGVGTIATYGKPGDSITFFEINPQVKEVAQKYFTFVKDSKAAVDVVIGDGRTSLEKRSGAAFDLLIVDAFNGDAIPVHLLTKDSFESYFKQITPDGALSIHITNGYLELAPLIGNIAQALNLESLLLLDRKGTKAETRYAFLTRNHALIEAVKKLSTQKQFELLTVQRMPVDKHIGIWTDDYSNLLSIVKKTIRQ